MLLPVSAFVDLEEQALRQNQGERSHRTLALQQAMCRRSCYLLPDDLLDEELPIVFSEQRSLIDKRKTVCKNEGAHLRVGAVHLLSFNVCAVGHGEIPAAGGC
jgi:hypothetical protein